MVHLNESLFSDIEVDEVTDNDETDSSYYQLIDSFTIDDDDIDSELIVCYIVSLYNKLFWGDGDCKEPCIYIEQKYDFAHNQYNKITMYDDFNKFSRKTITNALNETTPDNSTPMSLKFTVKFSITPSEKYDYESFIKDMYQIYRKFFVNSDYQDMYFHSFSFISDDGDSFMLWPSNSGKMIFSENLLNKMYSIIYKTENEKTLTPTEFNSRYTSKPNRGNITSIAIRLSRTRFKEFDINFILSNTTFVPIQNLPEDFNMIQKTIYLECNRQKGQPYKSGRIIDFIYQSFAMHIKKNDIKAEKRRNSDYLVLNIFVKTEPELEETKSNLAQKSDNFTASFDINSDGQNFTANIILTDEHLQELSSKHASKFGVTFNSKTDLFNC